jgi:hypothetical protein
VSSRILWIALASATLLAGTAADYQSAKRKMDILQNDKAKPGSRVEFTTAELNAYADQELPPGVRNTKLKIVGPGIATGSALVDFGKVRRSQGHPPGWLMSKILDGERPVTVTARISSANGRATVNVQSVEISGLTIDGGTLSFLIDNVLVPLYPDAAVNRPFNLGHNIERIEVQPAAVGIVIRK